MLSRYSREILTEIWSDKSKWNIILEIEILACEAWNKIGFIPDSDLSQIKSNARFDIDRVLEIEKHVKHDIISFLTNIAENVGHSSRFIHFGLTSSDVMDTCFSLQLLRSSDILIDTIRKILKALRDKAEQYKYTLCIGRTHGMWAEPMTLGMKFLRFYTEISRSLDRLFLARDEIRICKLSGTVGHYANIDPFIEEYVAEKLGLKVEEISTQVIPRDRHAFFFNVLAILASSIENFAIEIRHLQRAEVSEVYEEFSSGQKGSSAMPHKRNPINSENLTGLARFIRAFALPSMENISLWHERDISHSSVERFMGPDVCITMDFALNRMLSIINGLCVDSANISKNLEQTKGVYFSQRLLLALIKSGSCTREEAYSKVQEIAFSLSSGINSSFEDEVRNDTYVLQHIKNLDELCDINAYLKHIDMIFERVLNTCE